MEKFREYSYRAPPGLLCAMPGLSRCSVPEVLKVGVLFCDSRPMPRLPDCWYHISPHIPCTLRLLLPELGKQDRLNPSGLYPRTMKGGNLDEELTKYRGH